MGWFTKEERYNPETERFEAVEKPPLFRRKTREIRELTREEQLEPKRLQPWQTERGKRFIVGVKGAGKKVDRAIVNYNRRQPSRKTYSIHNNYNPFGTLFDSGMDYPKPKKSGSSKKYHISGGKAYPIAGTTSKKKKKTSRRRKRNDPFDFDIFDNSGFMR